MNTAERAPGPWIVEDAGTTWVVKRPGSSVVFMTRATKETAEQACAEANARFVRDRVRDAGPDLLAESRPFDLEWIDHPALSDELKITITVVGTTHESTVTVGDFRRLRGAIAKAEGR